MAKSPPSPSQSRWQRVKRWSKRALILVVVAPFLALALFGVVNPPASAYMIRERLRLGEMRHDWVPLEDISPQMQWAALAAEDARFCHHWGLDVAAIRAALADGSGRGGSSISQQTVKNLLLWHDRSYTRKALEAILTPAMEAMWSKKRILEVYLNIIEFDEGVFGVEAAAQHYFGVPARKLTELQAARLAMVLPNPRHRSASDPTAGQRARTRHILDGARTISRDSRVACLED